MSTFRAFWVERTEDKQFPRTIIERNDDDLPDGDLLVEVRYSSLNYKDGLSASGSPGVTRNYPHTPGIDAAGTVLSSSASGFSAGDEVVVIGFDLGMNTPGGYGQHIRIPAGWAVKLPGGLSLEQSMIIGTAGFTAALCIHKLEAAGMHTGSGPLLVAGATGGVGSIAVKLASQLGYEVHAVTAKEAQHAFLRDLGAAEILPREQLEAGVERPLLKETYGGVVDPVGGVPLVNALKQLKYGASLAACGLVNSMDLNATVLPFILRNVNLLGVDSVELPLEQKAEIWNKLAGPWQLDGLDALKQDLTLDTLSDAIDRILAGQMVGRGLVDLNG